MKKSEQKKLRSNLVAYGTNTNLIGLARTADVHLRAYILDRNPSHILKAAKVYLEQGISPPEVMQKNLLHAINEQPSWKPKGNTKRNTLRDALILTAIINSYGRKIPPKVDSAFLVSLADQCGMTVSATKMVVNRLRGKVKTLN